MTRGRAWGIVAILLATVFWGGSFAIIAVELRTTTTFSSPGSTSTFLTPGQWLIVERLPIDTSGSASNKSAIGKRTVNADQVSVRGPDGEGKVDVTCVYCSSPELMLPLDLKFYAGVGAFTVTQSGTYEISSTGSAATLGVADPVAGVKSGSIWWILTSLLGVISFGVGLGLLVRRPRQAIAGSATRGQASATLTASAPQGAAPSGWYPDPYGPEFERWWDGKTWTDHRR